MEDDNLVSWIFRTFKKTCLITSRHPFGSRRWNFRSLHQICSLVINSNIGQISRPQVISKKPLQCFREMISCYLSMGSLLVLITPGPFQATPQTTCSLRLSPLRLWYFRMLIYFTSVFTASPCYCLDYSGSSRRWHQGDGTSFYDQDELRGDILVGFFSGQER